MWTGKQQSDPSNSSQAPAPGLQTTPANPNVGLRASAPVVRNTSVLGAGLLINGTVSGDEDLHIDGKVEGPISLHGHRLTSGRTSELKSEISAREVIVYGKVEGNIRTQDRTEIKKDGSVVGNIVTARIVIEDGAYFKGRIEIERSNSRSSQEVESAEETVSVGAN